MESGIDIEEDQHSAYNVQDSDDLQPEDERDRKSQWICDNSAKCYSCGNSTSDEHTRGLTNPAYVFDQDVTDFPQPVIDVNLSLITGNFNLDIVPNGKWNILQLDRLVFSRGFENTINFAAQLGLIKLERNCPANDCGKKLALAIDRRPNAKFPVYFRCYSKSCSRSQFSLREKTLFGRSNLSIQQVILFAMCFVDRITMISGIQLQVSFYGETLSPHTVVDWNIFMREICLETVARHTSDRIGGPGLTVEVDESKFGKMKNGVGRFVDGQWYVGGICRETGDIFLAECPNNKRDAETLKTIITDHIKTNSIIITDCWKGYDWIDKSQKFSHLSVNHTYEFVSPTGSHTQGIESLWWQLKRSIPSTYSQRKYLLHHFAEYLYRRKFQRVNQPDNGFIQFLEHARQIYSGPNADEGSGDGESE